MFATRSIVRLAPQLRQLHSGSGSVIAGPPSNHISTLEKIGHALFMSVACLALPSYVLVNIRKYRGIEE